MKKNAASHAKEGSVSSTSFTRSELVDFVGGAGVVVMVAFELPIYSAGAGKMSTFEA